jgi:hypothetical protein
VLTLAFVMSEGQNRFFVELVGALRHELDRIGVRSIVTTGGFPALGPELVYVLFPPHEYFVLEGKVPDPALLSRTMFICAEQPSTSHFDQNVQLAPAAGAIFDINLQSVRQFALRGIQAHHLPLGYSAYWERPWNDSGRDVDVAFLGCETPRRARYLASYSPMLSRHRSHLVVTDNSAPNPVAAANFLVGDEKLRLLRRSKVLINVHQDQIPYFEWQRVLECVHSGCVVVSEHSTDYEPFVPGEHFASGRPEVLDLLAEELLEDSKARRSMQRRALERLKTERPLRKSAVELVETALELAARRPRAMQRRWRAPAWATAAPGRPAGQNAAPASLPAALDFSGIRSALKDLRLDIQDVRRELARSQVALAGGNPSVRVRRLWESPAYRGRTGVRVSVITALFNHARWITEALQSVADGDCSDLECIVVDDGSTDGSSQAVEAWSQRNRHVPLLLLGHPVNRGLPRSRNAALDFARGEYTFVLDSDNRVYPFCLSRLVAALEAAPTASFAYGMLARFDDEGFQGLISHFPWQPWRLRRGNYIDAMALLRTRALREMGGYTTDRRLYGWEDYDLYCRMAEQGMEAAFVPEIVAAYRASPTSMLSITDISHATAYAALREHCPTLMSGVDDSADGSARLAAMLSRATNLMEKVLG